MRARLDRVNSMCKIGSIRELLLLAFRSPTLALRKSIQGFNLVKTHRTQRQRFSPCSLPRTVCCKCVQHTLDFKTPAHPTAIRSFLRKHDQQVWLWKRQELSSNEHQLFNAIERRDAYNMWVCADGGLRFVQQGVMQRGAVSIGFVGWSSQS